MTELLNQLMGVVIQTGYGAGIVFLRVGAAIALLPGFGERSVPQRLRFALALMFTLVVTPAVIAELPDPGDIPFLRLLLSETLIGLGFGMMLRLAVIGLQTAGAIAAQSTSLAQIFGGTAAADPQPAFAHLLLISGLCLAMITGLHVKLTVAIIESYRLLPAGTIPQTSILTEIGIANVARAFATGFAIAAPFLVIAVLYNAAIGVINRAMPQLMVAFVGAPAITGLGLLALALVTPTLLQVWIAGLEQIISDPFGARP